MILLIDGRSGSGKSELATLLGLPVLRLDDVYPGWNGLAAASQQLPGIIETRRWQRFDWATGELAEWHELPDTVVIEGCGALTPTTRARADHALWVELDAPERRRRALLREPSFAPHWHAWAVQEDAHIAANHPRDLADEVVDGTDVSLVVDRWRALLDPARVRP